MQVPFVEGVFEKEGDSLIANSEKLKEVMI